MVTLQRERYVTHYTNSVLYGDLLYVYLNQDTALQQTKLYNTYILS